MSDAARLPTGLDTAAGTLGPLQFEEQRGPPVDSFTTIDTDNDTLKAIIAIASEIRIIDQDTMQSSCLFGTLSCPFLSDRDALRRLSNDTFDTARTVMKITERGRRLPPGLEHHLEILRRHMEDILTFVKRQQSGGVGSGWMGSSRTSKAYRKKLYCIFCGIDYRIALHRSEEDRHKGQAWPGSVPTDSGPSSSPTSTSPSPSTTTWQFHPPDFTFTPPQEFSVRQGSSGDDSKPSTETAGTNITNQYNYNIVHGDQYNNDNHNVNHVHRNDR